MQTHRTRLQAEPEVRVTDLIQDIPRTSASGGARESGAGEALAVPLQRRETGQHDVVWIQSTGLTITLFRTYSPVVENRSESGRRATGVITNALTQTHSPSRLSIRCHRLHETLILAVDSVTET